MTLFSRLFKRPNRPAPFRLDAGGRTDTGRMRAGNEDSFALLTDRRLFLVADGMGGHRAGEVASRLAIETVAEQTDRQSIAALADDPLAVEHFLARAFRAANKAVAAEAARDTTRRGMGTTLLAALILGDHLHTAHLGDSRCYLMTNGQLQQLTTDHNDAPDFPNVLTRAVGIGAADDPEYHRHPLNPGDRILLCTDGLWNMVGDAAIADMLAAAATPDTACEHLVRAANEAGGRDNITVICIFVGPAA